MLFDVLMNLFDVCRYSVVGMREHIKKRPPLATTEKVQQFVRVRDLSQIHKVTALYAPCNRCLMDCSSLQATGKEAIVAGFYHEGYEEPLLMLMRRRGVHSGLVIKVD